MPYSELHHLTSKWGTKGHGGNAAGRNTPFEISEEDARNLQQVVDSGKSLPEVFEALQITRGYYDRARKMYPDIVGYGRKPKGGKK